MVAIVELMLEGVQQRAIIAMDSLPSMIPINIFEDAFPGFEGPVTYVPPSTFRLRISFPGCPQVWANFKIIEKGAYARLGLEAIQALGGIVDLREGSFSIAPPPLSSEHFDFSSFRPLSVLVRKPSFPFAADKMPMFCDKTGRGRGRARGGGFKCTVANRLFENCFFPSASTDLHGQSVVTMVPMVSPLVPTKISQIINPSLEQEVDCQMGGVGEELAEDTSVTVLDDDLTGFSPISDDVVAEDMNPVPENDLVCFSPISEDMAAENVNPVPENDLVGFSLISEDEAAKEIKPVPEHNSSSL